MRSVVGLFEGCPSGVKRAQGCVEGGEDSRGFDFGLWRRAGGLWIRTLATISMSSNTTATFVQIHVVISLSTYLRRFCSSPVGLIRASRQETQTQSSKQKNTNQAQAPATSLEEELPQEIEDWDSLLLVRGIKPWGGAPVSRIRRPYEVIWIAGDQLSSARFKMGDRVTAQGFTNTPHVLGLRLHFFFYRRPTRKSPPGPLLPVS